MILTGKVASLGEVGGRAFRWNPGESLSDLQEGDILVTSMTTPEIIAGIGKIAGLVTETGGITCHAAIVAREFGLPAVIATKGASGIKTGAMLILEAGTDGEGKVVIQDAERVDKYGAVPSAEAEDTAVPV